ncbi:MAG: hypothetical protein ACUVQX_03750 [Candidatus Bathycorpusculaceae bacterium]
MTVSEKILKSLRTAASHIEKSMAALKEENENLFADSLWHAAAELEYALFLFSITFQDEDAASGLKLNPEPKKIGTMPNLDEVQGLLNEAERFMADGKPLESYKNAYVARCYMLKIEEDIVKRKREALKKK